MPSPPTPRRVLIVRMSHLGDIAQALTLVHAVREALPRAEIGWAIQPEFSALVAPLARVFPFDREGGIAAWPRLRRSLRAWDPDLALDAQGNWKSAACVRASGAPRRVGFARGEWQEPLASRLVGFEFADGDVAASSAPGRDGESSGHLVARCRRLARAALDPWRSRDDARSAAAPSATPMDPVLSPEEIASGAAALSAVHATGTPVVLHPGVEGDPRSWPGAKFTDLATVLARRLPADHRVLVLTGPAEAEIGASIRSALPEAGHVVGQRGLRELAALLRAVRDRGGRIVACDSGPAHVAASVGLPVHLLAGPEDPARTGPWPIIGSEGSPHRLVAAPEGWSNQSPWAPRSIDSVEVDDACESVLAETR